MNYRHIASQKSGGTVLLLILFAVAGMLPGITAAQSTVNLVGSQPVRADVMLLYQDYENDGANASQVSAPLSFSAGLGPGVTLSFRSSYMSAGGDLEAVSGMGDSQAFLSYSRRIGSGSIVASLGANLPTGTKELTLQEFTSVIVLSQRAYDFRVPSLGQGFGISPSLTWAVPVGGNAAIGLGASYQVRGGFKPIETLEEDYTPGNEILLTGGFDARVSGQSSFSLDASFSKYSADKLGDVEVYEAGGKTTLSARYRYVVGFDELQIMGVYRSRAKSSELSGGELVQSGSQTIPNQVNVMASYRRRVNESFSVTVLAEGRMFEETDFYDKLSMVDLGIVPRLAFSPQAALVGRFVYTLGDITGLEAGAGLSVTL